MIREGREAPRWGNESEPFDRRRRGDERVSSGELVSGDPEVGGIVGELLAVERVLASSVVPAVAATTIAVPPPSRRHVNRLDSRDASASRAARTTARPRRMRSAPSAVDPR